MNYLKQKKLRQAYAFVKTAIERGEIDGADRLPSMAALARMAGVSKPTVWRAVKALRHEGCIADSGSRRMADAEIRRRVIDAADNPPDRRTRSLDVQQRIRRDILNGRFRHDAPLPAEKELLARYGASRRTLRKALLGLAGQSILARRGPRFSPMLIAVSPGAVTPRVVLLGQGGTMGDNITWGYWHQEYLKLLETECAKAGITVDVVCFRRDDSGLRLIDGRTWFPYALPAKADVEGFVYEVTGDSSVEDDLLRMVAGIGRPVAVLDELGSWPSPAFLGRFPNVRVFRNTVTAAPALHVARFLLESGHRTAVFISPFHDAEYSRLRLDGLRQAFAGVDGARLIPVVSRFDGERYLTQEDTASRLTEVTGAVTKWAARFPAGAIPPAADRLVGSLRSEVAEAGFREELERLFTRALAVKDATAWIMVNDACAFWAITFLSGNAIPVPGRLSVISFDDDPVILTKGVTSYNFNQTATMIAMLRFITNPRLFPASRPVIEIEGRIIPRRTTGRARRE